jgi:uncharacterized protein YceH (UPF0502 family)
VLPPPLTATECRVLGCLMEKSVITPDQYPLTLNALTNACNQKSGRNPVMSLDPGNVQRSARELQAKHLVRVDENFRTGVEKYRQRLCNTTHSDFQIDPPQFAIICLLLLRGPQTPGELRAHSGRLHTFADNQAVVDALKALIEREQDPLVVQLPRLPGRKDCEYMHLLSGPIDLEAYAGTSAAERRAAAPERIDVQGLAERLSRLEAEVETLKARLDESV